MLTSKHSDGGGSVHSKVSKKSTISNKERRRLAQLEKDKMSEKGETPLIVPNHEKT